MDQRLVAVGLLLDVEIVIDKLEEVPTTNDALRTFVVVFHCAVSNSLICEGDFAFE